MDKIYGGSRIDKYVCPISSSNTKYIDFAANIPGPRQIGGERNNNGIRWNLTTYCSFAGCYRQSDENTASGYKLKSSVHHKFVLIQVIFNLIP